MPLLSKLRYLSLASALALGVAPVGCAAADEPIAGDSEEGASVDDITSVDHSDVKRQSIGNCWVYATASWLEALNKGATDEAKNTSESWVTYWHWYEQLANGRTSDEVSTGGSWGVAVDLILRYGLMMEGDFIPSEAEAEMSGRQSSALSAVNASLKSGAMKDAVASRDRRAIRRELDKAWGLDEATIARIDKVFGEGVTRTLDRSSTARRAAAESKILDARELPARVKDPSTGEFVRGSLADAIGKSAGWSSRTGKFAWNQVSYPYDARGRRALFKRVQNALHDRQPVVVSWKVDFNALTSNAHFSIEELQRRGPGRQGGHLTVMHDYEADVPGIGLLKAGEDATPEQMKAALADETKILFVRVKNSWGGIRPDRWSEAALPGYHDLDMGYLDGPIKDCPEGADRATCTQDITPLRYVVLPAGY